MEKNDFYEAYPIVNKYIQSGLLEKLYDDDLYIIGKFMNTTYVAIPKVIIENEPPLIVGISASMIDIILEYGLEAINHRIKFLFNSEEELKNKNMGTLTEESFNNAIKSNYNTTQKNMSKVFDPNLELKLKQLNAEKNEIKGKKK